jgi:signal transduction histidine kinase
MGTHHIRISESSVRALGPTANLAEVRRHQFLTDPHGLRGLLSASQLVTGELDLEELLRNIVDSAVTLVDAQYGALGVLDAEGRLERFIHVGMPAELVDRIGDLPEGRGVLGAVIDSSRPLRLDDLTADPRAVGFPEHHPPMRTFLGVPITIGGKTYGNLYLAERANGVFTEDDEALVTALAATAATAINNARLYDQACRAQRISAALSNTTARLLESAQSDIYGVLVENAAALAKAEVAYIVRPDADRSRLRIVAAHGDGAASLLGMSFPRTSSVLTRALIGERAMSASEIEEPLPLGVEGLSGSTIAVPLIVSGTAVGALCVARATASPPFVSGDLAMVSEFVLEAGIAVALAQERLGRQRLEVTEDRARIARDLHDHVIQQLFGTGLGLQALASAHPSHTAVLEEHISAIDTAITDIRTAIFDLQTRGSSKGARHRILDAVTEWGPRLTTDPRVTLTGPIDLMITGHLVEDVVAVIREALANIARHAKAETIEVAVVATSADVTVTVSDDGVGQPASSSRSSGISNLSKRAASHGGTFALEPITSGGSCARWYVPVMPETQA